jgi:hypothetical protein
MLNLCLRSSILGLLVTLALVGVAGCSSKSLVAQDGGNKTPAPDGSFTGGDASDPAACGCQVDDQSVLTISWECYCKQYDCTRPLPPSGADCSADDFIWMSGCGFRGLSILTVGGPEAWVYTDAGQLIGAQLGSDTGEFTCPTAPSLHGYALRAG